MTEKYDPYDNAIAERVNRILKQEFAVAAYNTNLITKKKTSFIQSYVDSKQNAQTKITKKKRIQIKKAEQ